MREYFYGDYTSLSRSYEDVSERLVLREAIGTARALEVLGWDRSNAGVQAKRVRTENTFQ